MCAEYAPPFVLRGLEHHGAGAVAEDHAHVPAARGEVQTEGVLLAADHKDVPVHPAPDELVGHAQGVDEAAALVADVQRTDLAHLHGPLQEHAASREVVVGAQRGEDDEVDLLRRGARPLDGFGSRLHGHGGGGLRGPVGVPAFTDARPLLDPLVAGLHVLEKVVVGNHVVRHVHADAGDPGASHKRFFGRMDKVVKLGERKGWRGWIRQRLKGDSEDGFNRPLVSSPAPRPQIGRPPSARCTGPNS